jgi:hypothetical protein
MFREHDSINALDAIISQQEHWDHVVGQGCPRDAHTGQANVTSNIDPNRDLNHRVPVHRACFVILSRSKSKSGEHRFCLLTGCARRTTVLKNDNSR